MEADRQTDRQTVLSLQVCVLVSAGCVCVCVTGMKPQPKIRDPPSICLLCQGRSFLLPLISRQFTAHSVFVTSNWFRWLVGNWLPWKLVEKVILRVDLVWVELVWFYSTLVAALTPQWTSDGCQIISRPTNNRRKKHKTPLLLNIHTGRTTQCNKTYRHEKWRGHNVAKSLTHKTVDQQGAHFRIGGATAGRKQSWDHLEKTCCCFNVDGTWSKVAAKSEGHSV